MLLAHCSLPVDAIGSALAACVDAGIVDSDIVILEARRAVDDRTATVVPIGPLAPYDRLLPTIAHFDQLLEAAR